TYIQSPICSTLLHNSLFLFSFPRSDHHLDQHSFPTGRSSDLYAVDIPSGVTLQGGEVCKAIATDKAGNESPVATRIVTDTTAPRSEEHTSELQSRFDLVCRLLLEKKNNKTVAYPSTIQKQKIY